MKKTLALAALILSNSAFAADVYMGPNTNAQPLRDCKGTITTQYTNDGLNLVFHDMLFCSTFSIVTANGALANYSKPIQIQGNAYGGSFTIPKRYIDPGKNKLLITLSGQASDVVSVKFREEAPAQTYPAPSYPAPSYPRPAPAQTAGQIIVMNPGEVPSLPSCGGTAEATISPDKTAVNLVFHGLTMCSNFSIAMANGSDTDYAKPILKEGQGSRARGGSFTIPARYIDSGYNALYIQLSSDSGKHSDLLKLNITKTDNNDM